MGNKIIIKEAKIEEAQEIRRLEEKVWGEEVVNKYDIPMFVRFGHVFVAKDNDKIIGAICSYFTKNSELYICDLVVDKNYRGRKIGMNLYKALIKKTKQVSLISFINHKSIESLKLHKKLGFKTIKKVNNPYCIKENNLDEGVCFFVKLKR